MSLMPMEEETTTTLITTTTITTMHMPGTLYAITSFILTSRCGYLLLDNVVKVHFSFFLFFTF